VRVCCPHCKKLVTTGGEPGTVIACPDCKKPMTLPAKASSGGTAAATPNAHPDPADASGPSAAGGHGAMDNWLDSFGSENASSAAESTPEDTNIEEDTEDSDVEDSEEKASEEFAASKDETTPSPSRKRTSRASKGYKKSVATDKLKFACPHCNQLLSVLPASAGLMFKCPSCNNRVRAPELGKTERRAWKESDPTNPHSLTTLFIGVVLVLLWFVLLCPFNPPENKPTAEYSTMEFLASLFYKHFTASLLNTLFFTWSMSIIFMKYWKIRLQKAALLLDVLPTSLGKKIHAGNVAVFIDHVYSLPIKLRDSLMVNRIRKALELFEIRQNVSDVREMMVNQSEIDGARISGSYTLVRAFLWGIPLLGFIGTVVGLSHAIGGMNFANVDDVGKVVGAINNVTSGLGTAFDATLLGLVLALTLNFPLNALAKQEDDNLCAIDAFCNEVLLPRLKDSSASHAMDMALAPEEMRSLVGAKEKFLADLNELAQHMNDYADKLNGRIDAFQKTIIDEFVTKTAEMRTNHQTAMKEALERMTKCQETLSASVAAENERLRVQTEKVLQESSEQVAKYIGGLETGIGGLNRVLEELGQRQVVVSPPKRWRWFGRR